MHLNVRFSTETELKKIQDFLYEKSGQGVSFTGLVEAMANEVTIVTAVHNIKSNKGSRTAGVDKIKMDKYLQMPKDELILLIQSSFRNYRPKPARREYIEKSNGKKRPLGIPTVLDRIIQECVRIIIEPICEARFYPQSYGFRPYRAQKHAIRGIINVINAGCKSPDQPVWAIEGDIKGCFDNINHRLLLQKLWRIGIHDKRVLKIISQMLKAGYMENDLFHATELGTPQGGILSPLLSNVYLNDFDWYVGRMYMEPHRQCKHKGNDTRRLKWAGVTPKYNYRYADDWVILTSTEKEALRLKRVLTKYFRNRMKLELSQEKTYVTDLRTNGIHFLGFVVKAERKRKTPDPATWTKHLVGKPLPDMERLGKKIKKGFLSVSHFLFSVLQFPVGAFLSHPCTSPYIKSRCILYTLFIAYKNPYTCFVYIAPSTRPSCSIKISLFIAGTSAIFSISFEILASIAAFSASNIFFFSCCCLRFIFVLSETVFISSAINNALSCCSRTRLISIERLISAPIGERFMLVITAIVFSNSCILFLRCRFSRWSLSNSFILLSKYINLLEICLTA